MRHRTLTGLIFILFLFGGSSVIFAADNTVDPREAAIDRAIGGMVEGSRPLLPQSYAGKNQAHKVPGGGLSSSMDTRVTASASTQNSPSSNAINSPSGNAETGANNAGVNSGGTIHETTTGGNIEGNVSGGTETTGPAEPTTEPTTGGSANDSIINVDANVDLSGGSPTADANLTVDTNADTLLDANTSAATDVISTDATVTESGTVAGEDLAATVNEAPLDATLESEVVATDVPTDSEATAGLEADVDPVTADSDVTVSDPADGLSTTVAL